MFYVIVTLMVLVLAGGLMLLTGRKEIPEGKEKKYAIGAMTAGMLLALVAFLVPRAQPPAWLLRVAGKTVK